MTIRLPKKTIIDKLLNLIGYKRKVQLPGNSQELKKSFGPYVQIKAKWKNLLQRKDDK